MRTDVDPRRPRLPAPMPPPPSMCSVVHCQRGDVRLGHPNHPGPLLGGNRGRGLPRHVLQVRDAETASTEPPIGSQSGHWRNTRVVPVFPSLQRKCTAGARRSRLPGSTVLPEVWNVPAAGLQVSALDSLSAHAGNGPAPTAHTASCPALPAASGSRAAVLVSWLASAVLQGRGPAAAYPAASRLRGGPPLPTSALLGSWSTRRGPRRREASRRPRSML